MLQSRERVHSLQKLCSFQRRGAEMVESIKVAEVLSGIREIIKTTRRKRRISGSALIASGNSISQRTARASNVVIPQTRPTWRL
jgi:hypothetical protein